MTEAAPSTEHIENRSLKTLLEQISRATLGAAVPERSDATGPETVDPRTKHVVFELADAQYAVPMNNVRELQRLPRITALPNVPDWVSGVTNLRGDVLSVVDLRTLLGMPAAQSAASQRLIVVCSTREEITTGWIVDRLVGLRGITPEELKPCSTLMTGSAVSFLNGIVERDGRLIAVLDVNRVLSSPEMRQFEPTWQEA